MSPAFRKPSRWDIVGSQPTKHLMHQQSPYRAKLERASALPMSGIPTPAYLQLVDTPPSITLDPLDAARRKKHLLILDLNGTLVSRTRKRNAMLVRPYIDIFLDYIFDHFKVMVWSSAQVLSVNHMLFMFGEKRKEKLVKVWNRAHFGLSKTDYFNKTPTIKDLERVWKSPHFKKYDVHSTVILDDSPSKSVLQPFNSIHLDTFDHNSDDFLTHGDQELLSVMDYLKRIQLQTNIPNFMRNTPYDSTLPLTNWNKALTKESRKCYYYSFYDDQAQEIWDFSKTPVKVDKTGADNKDTTESGDTTDSMYSTDSNDDTTNSNDDTTDSSNSSYIKDTSKEDKH